VIGSGHAHQYPTASRSASPAQLTVQSRLRALM